MKILIDNSNLFAGGGIQVATSFLYDLLQLDDNNEYHIVQSVNCQKQLDSSIFDKRFKFYNVEKCSLLKRRSFVKNVEYIVQPNVIFVTFGPSYHKSSSPKIVGFALGQILYKHSPYFSTLNIFEFFKINLITKIKSFFFLKNSDVLIYETQDANDIYSKLTKSRLTSYTVSNTLNNIFNNCGNWQEILITKSDFDIVYLTANYAHKNLNIIPKIIDKLKVNNKLKNFKFHVSVTKEEVNFDDKYDSYINYLGNVNINQVPNLYKKMDIMIMPSLLETFSTSYLEAMASDLPIVASDMGFARDICNDSALYVEPLNSTGFAEAIENLYNDHSLKAELVEKGNNNLKRFGNSMDRTKKYLKIIQETFNNARN